MLTTKCIHPQLLQVLSLCGHGDKILIGDGNYPLLSKSGDAEKVYLGLMPGLPSATDVLTVLQSITNFERAEVMQPEDGSLPEIFNEFSTLLGPVKLEKLNRSAFYEACCKPDLQLAISTGEARIFANILLTIGVA